MAKWLGQTGAYGEPTMANWHMANWKMANQHHILEHQNQGLLSSFNIENLLIIIYPSIQPGSSHGRWSLSKTRIHWSFWFMFLYTIHKYFLFKSNNNYFLIITKQDMIKSLFFTNETFIELACSTLEGKNLVCNEDFQSHSLLKKSCLWKNIFFEPEEYTVLYDKY